LIYRFEDWELDTGLYELRRGGRVRRVEPQVFDLLHLLVRNHERVVGKEEMVAEIWDGRIVSEATISTCLKAARQALGDDGRDQRLIRTVHRRGFRFVGTLGEAAQPEEPAAEAERAPVAAGERLSEKPVVAVLPFDNLSEAADGYFADGVSEDVITNLSRFRDLLVIGRSSTFRFRGRPTGLGEICRELGADYLVQGSLRRAGQRVRLTAQLVDGATGVHLWADSYDREMEDIFAVQDDLARTVAARLGVSMQDAALKRSLKKSPTELDAYDCVLRARRYTRELSAEAHAEARDLLERAVALDPGNADAASLLANVYLAEHRFEVNPRPDPIGRALVLAERAVKLDPQSAYARCWLAIVHFFRGENETFEAEAARALALNPNDPETLADIGHYLAFMGQFDRGVALSRRAQELNPLHPDWYHFSFARYHYDRRAYQETLAAVARINLPHFYWMHLLRAAALGQLGRPDAGSALLRVYQVKPDFDARAELLKWNAAPHDLEHLLEGLRKAGLKG